MGKMKKERNLQSATMAHIKGPTSKESIKIMENFETAEQYSMLASAISGGVESPIQFVIQVILCIRNLWTHRNYTRIYLIYEYLIYEFLLFKVWLILTGKIDYPWAPNWYQFKDWNGNSIYVPTTACFSLIFSVLAMIKAVIHFNIARIHVGVSAIIQYLTTKSF